MNRILSPRRRWLVWLLIGLGFVAALVNGLRAWAAYREWTLRRMPLEQLEAVVRRSPGDVEARYRLALAYERANRPTDAVRELVTVLDLDPTRADVLNDLGALYLVQGRYYECLVALQGALIARPQYSIAYANLGRLHIAVKMPFTAVRELERAARLDPRNVDTLCDLGEAYQRTLNFTAAEAVYRRALRIRPRSVPAHLGLAKTLYSTTRYEQAEKELERTLALSPEEPTALITLGRIRLERALSAAELKEVRDYFRRAARADPNDPEAWFDLGRVALRQRKYDEAVQFLRRAVEMAPEHAGASYQLGRALRAAGRPKDADRVVDRFRQFALRTREQVRLEEELHRSPGDVESALALVEIYLQSGQTGLARFLAVELSRSAPGDPRVASLLRKVAAAPAAAPGSTGASPGLQPTTGMPEQFGGGRGIGR